MNEIIDTFTAEVVPKYDKLTKGKYALDSNYLCQFSFFSFSFFLLEKLLHLILF